MPVPLTTFIKNPHAYIPLLAVCMLFVIALFIGITELGGMQNRLVLHEDIQGQIDLTGSVGEIFSAVGIAFILCVMNALLAKSAYSRERLLSYMLLYANIWIAVLALIFMVSVANLN